MDKTKDSTEKIPHLIIHVPSPPGLELEPHRQPARPLPLPLFPLPLNSHPQSPRQVPLGLLAAYGGDDLTVGGLKPKIRGGRRKEAIEDLIARSVDRYQGTDTNSNFRYEV